MLENVLKNVMPMKNMIVKLINVKVKQFLWDFKLKN